LTISPLVLSADSGHTELIPPTAQFIKGDIRNKQDLESCFSNNKIDVVFHFCASIEVAESVSDPLKYYENNVGGTINLLQAMQKHGTKVF
jgi:UDP-glucose 4-epimerase